MPNIAHRHFRPELLPVPRSFYERELGRLSRPSRGWASCSCPFHDGRGRRKRSTSFGVNLDTGAFNCFTCGAKGDVIKFVMLRDGVGFKAAAQVLGAWDEAPPLEALRQAEARERERQAAKLREAADRQHLISLRDNLLTARRLHREISEQLLESGGGEDLWHALSALHDYVRECDLEYCAFAGLEYQE